MHPVIEKLHRELVLLRGTTKVKKHLTIGLVAASAAPLFAPEIGPAASIAAIVVNVIWIWEG